MDKKIVKFLCFLLIATSIANTVQDIVIPYNRTLAENLWKAIIILSLGAYFVIGLYKRRKIKKEANLSMKENAFLNKAIRSSTSYKFYMRRIITFILIWILLSAVCIFVFVTVLEDWKNTGWEAVKVLAITFGILGAFLLVVAIIPDLKNSFPDIRKILARYNLTSIETSESIHFAEGKIPQSIVGEENLWLRESYIGVLPLNSKLGYEIEMRVISENTLANGKVIKTLTNIINLEISIDMKETLTKDYSISSNKIELNTRLKKFFDTNSIMTFDNVNFENNVLKINLNKIFYFDSRLICEYLIGVLKSCYELEKAFIFLA